MTDNSTSNNSSVAPTSSSASTPSLVPIDQGGQSSSPPLVPLSNKVVVVIKEPVKEKELEVVGEEPSEVDATGRVAELEAEVMELAAINDHLLDLYADAIARCAAQDFRVSNLTREVDKLKEQLEESQYYERDRKRAQV